MHMEPGSVRNEPMVSCTVIRSKALEGPAGGASHLAGARVDHDWRHVTVLCGGSNEPADPPLSVSPPDRGKSTPRGRCR